MTQNSRNLTANLQYKVNQQSIQAAVQANQQVAQSFQSTQAAAGRAAVQFNTVAQAAAALNLSSAQLQQMGLQTQVVANNAAAATRQIQNLAAAAASIPSLNFPFTSAASPAKVLGNLANVGIALPGIGFQSPLVVGLRAASLAADKTGASFLQVGAAAGLLGAAVVGIGIAFSEFNETIKDAKQNLSAALDAQQQYYDAVRDLSTQQAKDRVDELARNTSILRQQAAETRNAANQAFLLEQTLPGGDALARVLNRFGVTASADLAKRADELEQELNGAEQAFTRLKQGVKSGAFVFNDVAEAQEALTKVLKDSSDAINDGLKDIASAAQDVRDAQEAVADIRRELVDASADAALKSRELAQDTDQKVLDAQADAEERRREIAADGAERREQIEQDNADRRAEILDRFNTDYNNAVASRDALAAHKAKQTRDDDLDKQDKAYRKQLDQLQKQLDKQLAAVDKALDKQLRNIQKQFERQQAAIDDAYNKQYRNLQESLNKALAAEQFANNRLESLRSDNAYRATYWAGIVEVANKRMADAAAALAVSLNQSANLLGFHGGAPANGNPGNVGTGGGGGGGISGGGGGGGGGFPPLSDPYGNLLLANRAGLGAAVTDPRALLPTSLAARSGRGSLPGSIVRSPVSTYNGGRTVNLTFAPTLNSAQMSDRQFERRVDIWMGKVRQAVSGL